jgi:hypothetical protein
MDKRKFNGAKPGENRNAGRKPKVTELQIIELLTPLDKTAFKSLEKGVKSGELGFIKLYFEYRFGKPKQIQDSQANNNDGLRTWNIVFEEPTIKLPGGQEIKL